MVLWVALISIGCYEKPLIPGADDDVVIVPEGGPYIYLDAMVGNKTRGTLVEGNELEEGFGAYGFTYDFTNRWTTYRATATPNVFESTPQEVTYADEIYSYSPTQKWTGGKYTFFAYYPYGHNSVVPSDVTNEGTPYVTYAPKDFLTSTANHKDVMTAMFEDTSLSSSQYVNFNFQHRLSAIEVVALNFYEYNHKEGGNVTTEEIEIEITGLTITFDKLKYQAATFSLDSRLASTYTLADKPASYSIVSSGSKIVEYSHTSAFQRIDPDQTMLVIPQSDESLKVTTEVSFKKKRPGNQGYVNEGGVEEFTTTKETAFGQALKAGSRYYIQITFTSAAVSINIITSAEWEDLAEDVYHEFE